MKSISPMKALHIMTMDHRLAILRVLYKAKKPMMVGKIGVGAKIIQALTSQQLKILFDCNIVTKERKGNCVYYDISKKYVPVVKNLMAICK